MDQKHYKDELTAFVDHELSREAQHEIGEHLLQCGDCRAEHDRIKLGAALAGNLRQSDASASVWNEIAGTLDGKRAPEMRPIGQLPYFGGRALAGYAVAVLVVAGLVSVAYLTLFRSTKPEAEKAADRPVQTQNSDRTPLPEVAVLPVNADAQNSNALPGPTNAADGTSIRTPDLASAPAWQFETISGKPSVGASSGANSLTVGDFLETDAASRARITVADIGNVKIEPNSRVKLVGTTNTEHRLSLERGVLQAQISAPPRLFIVDTPSAVAVDLGCEYKLEVDKAGNSKLSVTKGFVALENGGRESIVPAGAECITRRGHGLGTPFSADTTEDFRMALERFDFSKGGSSAVQDMLASRNYYDMVTLWHLLSRVQKTDREKVFDALSDYVKPPADITRKGVLNLDKKMLASWRVEVERVWFE